MLITAITTSQTGPCTMLASIISSCSIVFLRTCFVAALWLALLFSCGLDAGKTAVFVCAEGPLGRHVVASGVMFGRGEGYFRQRVICQFSDLAVPPHRGLSGAPVLGDGGEWLGAFSASLGLTGSGSYWAYTPAESMLTARREAEVFGAPASALHKCSQGDQLSAGMGVYYAKFWGDFTMGVAGRLSYISDETFFGLGHEVPGPLGAAYAAVLRAPVRAYSSSGGDRISVVDVQGDPIGAVIWNTRNAVIGYVGRHPPSFAWTVRIVSTKGEVARQHVYVVMESETIRSWGVHVLSQLACRHGVGRSQFKRLNVAVNSPKSSSGETNKTIIVADRELRDVGMDLDRALQSTAVFSDSPVRATIDIVIDDI